MMVDIQGENFSHFMPRPITWMANDMNQKLSQLSSDWNFPGNCFITYIR